VTPLPAAPANLTLTATSLGSINVSWDEVDDVSGYCVYRATSLNGTYTRVATVKTGQTFDNTGLTAGKRYYYKVRAYCKPGASYVYGYYSEKKSLVI
jgi:fibronectin type 3 domain-containing protein